VGMHGIRNVTGSIDDEVENSSSIITNSHSEKVCTKIFYSKEIAINQLKKTTHVQL
jgi:hypothetical protein